MSLTGDEQMRRKWTVEVVGGDTDLGFEDWKRGVGTPTPQLHRPPLHTPPVMGDGEQGDGVFTFFDDHTAGNELEVIPQITGNVEIVISLGGDGVLFTLSHLDRADLIRALLHDFHYSPETGGPADD